MRIGDTVRLKPNAKEGFPEEFGSFLGKDGSAYMVQVFPAYREGRRDDGLRDVTLSQIAPVHPDSKRTRRAKLEGRARKTRVK